MAKKEMLPLVLSVKATNWRMNDEESSLADAEFRHVRLQALDRDQRMCQFCGFQSQKWQEVHHRDDDHSNNALSNLVTTCTFCHMVQHIGLAGRNKEAVLAYIPEIPQDRLHHIVRSILIVNQWALDMEKDRRQKTEVHRAAKQMAEAAKSLEDKLRAREADAQKLFNTSEPLELGAILQQMANEHPALYEKRGQILRGLRLLPLGKRTQNGKEIMPEIVASWMESGGPYASLLPRTWITILRNMGDIA
jgi:intracellular multiplication protein IcmJ